MTEQALTPVTPRAGGRIQATVPQTVEELSWVAGMIVGCGMAPDSYTKEKGRDLPPDEVKKRVAIGIMAGAEVGMAPLHSLANIALINNKPTVYGKGAFALVQASHTLESHKTEVMGEEPEPGAPIGDWPDSYGLRVILRRKGQEEPYIGEYTVGDAKRAQLWMNARRRPWIEHTKDMLFWRAFGRASGKGFSDVLCGLLIRELVEDMPAPEPEAPDTSFLDDDATPEPLPAPAPEDEAAPVEIAEAEAAEVADEEEPDVPSARIARLGDDTSAWTNWIKAMAAAIKAAESEAEIDALMDDPGNVADLGVLEASSQGNHHKLMQLAEGRRFELQSLGQPAEEEAEPELEPEPAE